MPEKVTSNALWQQMELRQKVMNAREFELDLGISIECAEDSALDNGRDDTTMSIHASSESQTARGKQKIVIADHADDLNSGSWDGNGMPRKFWIPSSDCNIVMGGAEPIIATSNTTTLQRHASRLSATIHPDDVQWAADFAAVTSQARAPLRGDANMQGPSEPLTVNYTHFPPFRFSAEFPNPRVLKEKKRVYSRTVFYAGSLWNIYIQKVASSRSKQLGVYLHRAKERETEEVIAGTAGLARGSVDERIGQLEREMIMRGEGRERRRRRRTAIDSHGLDGEDVESAGSAGVDDGRLAESASLGSARVSTMRSLLSTGGRKSSQTDILNSSPPLTSNLCSGQGGDIRLSDSDSEGSGYDSEAERLAAALKQMHVPTLPAYVDARPTIRTYFKIYSPSRGGRMLSVYESAPDKFNFSQSWGWKSSTLMLDEGYLDEDEDSTVSDAQSGDGEGRRGPVMAQSDGKLRFMVVIGNI